MTTVHDIDSQALCEFLVQAKAETYAADDDSRVRALADGGSDSSFERGDYVYRDRWYGGARFAGQELVWHRGFVSWSMNFHGVTSPDASPEFFHFHKRALRRPPPEAPFRGPALHREGALVYVNDWRGSLAAFQGVERAFDGDREMYRLEYHGGRLG